MKRDFLEALKLDADTIDKIMAENGKDITREKQKFADYDEVKQQLENANKTMEKFKDYDQTKADVEKYKQEAAKAQADAAAKIALLDMQSKIKDYTNGKKFVNDLTREAINAQLEKELNKEESKGTSLEDLFKKLTDGKENILVDENKPTPPVTPPMQGSEPASGGVAAAFKAMNPNLKF